MVQITVNLSPSLTGAQSKLYLVVGDAIYPIIDLPPSQNGVISSSIAVSSPELDYTLIFPEQTIEGIAYVETMSSLFNLISDVVLNMILEPVTPPTPPVDLLWPAVSSAIMGTLAVIWSLS